jgi:hypothetical protein
MVDTRAILYQYQLVDGWLFNLLKKYTVKAKGNTWDRGHRVIQC